MRKTRATVRAHRDYYLFLYCEGGCVQCPVQHTVQGQGLLAQLSIAQVLANSIPPLHVRCNVYSGHSWLSFHCCVCPSLCPTSRSPLPMFPCHLMLKKCFPCQHCSQCSGCQQIIPPCTHCQPKPEPPHPPPHTHTHTFKDAQDFQSASTRVNQRFMLHVCRVVLPSKSRMRLVHQCHAHSHVAQATAVPPFMRHLLLNLNGIR